MSSSTFAGIFLLSWFVVSPTSANDWIAEGEDILWSTPENWSQGVPPLNATSDPAFGWDDPDGVFYPLTPDESDDGPLFNNDAKLTADDATVLIDSSVEATAYGVRIGMDGASNTLQMTGGSLQVGGVPPNGGDPVGWHLDVGRGINRTGNDESVALLIISGGEVETNGFLIPESFVDSSLADPYDTPGVNGAVIMSGGQVTGRWMNVGQFTGNGNVELSGDAVINLWPNVPSNRNNGGHFEMKRNWFIDGQPVATVSEAFLDIRDDAVINIFGARNEFTMTPNQSEVDRMQQYIDDGWLTANNGTEDPILTLQACPDDGTYDEFCLSGMMITITAPPRTEVVGDFNSDTNLNCTDIDALVAEIVAGSNNPDFDLNGDSVVDSGDITDSASGWLVLSGAKNSEVTGGSPFSIGDANLDGSVNEGDHAIWSENRFSETAAWCSGDFSADGFVDGSDFNLWNSNNAENLGNVAVPEPGHEMILWGLGLSLLWRRRDSVSH